MSKRKSKSFLVGILPRMDSTREISSRILNMNSRLERLCGVSGIGFIDMWSRFYGDGSLYCRDGLHLNRKGSFEYAKKLEQGLSSLGF